jgi:hypothetical protein
MGALSELPLTAERVESVLLAKTAQPVNLHYVPDEEFPPDLPVGCDWILQPASQRYSRRVLGLIVVGVVALLIAGSLGLVYWPPSPLPSVSGLPS